MCAMGRSPNADMAPPNAHVIVREVTRRRSRAAVSPVQPAKRGEPNSGSYFEASTGSAWSAVSCAVLVLTACFLAMRRDDAQL